MKGAHNILIIDADNRSVSTLFKRSIGEFTESSICIDCVTSFDEAKRSLKEHTFDIVSLGDIIPGFQNGFFGSKLIPFIKNSTSCNATIVLMYSDDRYLNESHTLCLMEGFSESQIKGVNKNEIRKDVKLNKNFELIPIRQSATI